MTNFAIPATFKRKSIKIDKAENSPPQSLTPCQKSPFQFPPAKKEEQFPVF